MSLLLVAAAMGWLSRLAFKLDADGKAALRQAAFEENIRLALWRMDSTLSGLISMENARPYESYPALIHAMPYSENSLAYSYFQFDPRGRLILPASAKQQSIRWNELRRLATQSALLSPIRYTTDIHTVQRIAPPAAKTKEHASRDNKPTSRIETPVPAFPASPVQRPSDSGSGVNGPPKDLPRDNALVQRQLNLNEASARESIISQSNYYNFQNFALDQGARSLLPNGVQVVPLPNALPAGGQNASPSQSRNVAPALPQSPSPNRSQTAGPAQFNDNNSAARVEPQALQMQKLSESISGSNAAAPISRTGKLAQTQMNSNEVNARELIVNENIQLNYRNMGTNQVARSQLPASRQAAPLPNPMASRSPNAPPQNAPSSQSPMALAEQAPSAQPALSPNAPPSQSPNALSVRLPGELAAQIPGAQTGQSRNAPLSQSRNAPFTQSPNPPSAQIQNASPAPTRNTAPAQSAIPREVIQTTRQDTNLEMMNAIWLDKDLFLVRRAYIGNQEFIQGCWLNWLTIRAILLERVEDLLPHADLAPLPNAPVNGKTRLLASIPAMLVPGPVPEEPRGGWSILHMSLSIAWAGVLLAIFAVAVVLYRAMELNQRRGAFVSAVTHELRTPLTTFRLYTEMLDAGMVTEEVKRKQYYGTLHGEAERLSHLVENVLMYAQLENSRGGAERIETVQLADLKERMTPSLSERAVQCGMKLAITIDEPARHAAVRADISAVERVLFNLVDNAGKYGRVDRNPEILMSMALKDGMAVVSVSDRGPGVAPHLQKKLFMPFSKSASEAANSAPGVGLGLSISRGLARQMRGDLQYDIGFKDGARFVLTLPLA